MERIKNWKKKNVYEREQRRKNKKRVNTSIADTSIWIIYNKKKKNQQKVDMKEYGLEGFLRSKCLRIRSRSYQK